MKKRFWPVLAGSNTRVPQAVVLPFYLRTSPEVAIKRKKDIPSEEYLKERTLYYDSVAGLLRAHIIDGDQPLPIVLDRVQECINHCER